MKKFYIAFACIICIVFCSCNKSPDATDEIQSIEEYEEYFEEFESIAASNFESVILSLQSCDEASLKKLFSKKVLSGMDDYSSAFEKMIDFIDGNIVSWETYPEKMVNVSDIFGENTAVQTCGKITTDTQKEYLIRVHDYVFDKFNKRNQGIYMVMVASWDYDKCDILPGIQLPQSVS